MTEKPLLGCPFCGHVPEVDEETTGYSTVACIRDDCDAAPVVVAGRTRTQAIERWNRRSPSPAPAAPEGEPDFVKLTRETFWHVRETLWPAIAQFGQSMYRLGASSRAPVAAAAVKDEEVRVIQQQIGAVLSDPALPEQEARHLLTRIADLIERLSMKVTSLSARDAGWSLQCQEAEADLAKAREDLAKADAALYWFHARDWPCYTDTDRERHKNLADNWVSAVPEAMKRHAARQRTAGQT